MYEWTTVTVDVKRRYSAQDVHAFLDDYLRERVDDTPPESYYKDDGRIVIRLNRRHINTAREAVDAVQERDGEVFRAAVLCGNDTGDDVTDLHVYDWLVDETDWFEPIDEYDDRLYKDNFEDTMTDILGWTPETGYWVDDDLRDGHKVVTDKLRDALDDRSNLRAETRNVLVPETRPDDWENPLNETTDDGGEPTN